MIPIYRDAEALERLKQLGPANTQPDSVVVSRVSDIINRVRKDGDAAIKALAEQFNEPVPAQLQLPQAEVDAAVTRVPAEIKSVLNQAAENIRSFGQSVVAGLKPVHLKRDGFEVGLDYRPIERVGCYVPGGRYPLPSTALMTTLTAQAAGVKHIAIASPKLKDETIYAGTLAGVSHFYQVGGAQAVAALALGTQSISSVDMVVGPGNAYVTEAKRQLQGVIGIDMLAGPSEVTIIADDGAEPRWVALDLLAQAEHDPDARAYLLTTSSKLAETVSKLIPELSTQLQLPEFITQALAASGIFVLPSLEVCVEASNQLAPEHLELHVSDPVAIKPQLDHYGALFMGYQATVPFGDYMAGPNHTLPTARTARFSGSLSPLTFLRPQSWFYPTGNIANLATATNAFANLEGLTAHAAAAGVRLD